METIHQSLKVRYPGDDTVRVYMSSYNTKELRKDLIKAAKTVFKRVPEVERLEFDLEEERTVSTTRKDMESVSDDASISDQDVVKLLKEHFDLSQYTTLAD